MYLKFMKGEENEGLKINPLVLLNLQCKHNLKVANANRLSKYVYEIQILN